MLRTYYSYIIVINQTGVIGHVRTSILLHQDKELASHIYRPTNFRRFVTSDCTDPLMTRNLDLPISLGTPRFTRNNWFKNEVLSL